MHIACRPSYSTYWMKISTSNVIVQWRWLWAGTPCKLKGHFMHLCSSWRVFKNMNIIIIEKGPKRVALENTWSYRFNACAYIKHLSKTRSHFKNHITSCKFSRCTTLVLKYLFSTDISQSDHHNLKSMWIFPLMDHLSLSSHDHVRSMWTLLADRLSSSNAVTWIS